MLWPGYFQVLDEAVQTKKIKMIGKLGSDRLTQSHLAERQVPLTTRPKENPARKLAQIHHLSQTL